MLTSENTERGDRNEPVCEQKGTGKARQGGIRNPHYKGGGVAFGPKNEKNFTIKMPKKQRAKALLITFSKKLQEEKVFALDKFDEKLSKTKT